MSQMRSRPRSVSNRNHMCDNSIPTQGNVCRWIPSFFAKAICVVPINFSAILILSSVEYAFFRPTTPSLLEATDPSASTSSALPTHRLTNFKFLFISRAIFFFPSFLNTCLKTTSSLSSYVASRPRLPELLTILIDYDNIDHILNIILKVQRGVQVINREVR